MFASLNYERQLTALPRLSLRVGAGLYGEKAAYLSLPVGLNYLIKLARPNSFIDAGLGATWAQANGRLFRSETNSSSNNFFSYQYGFVPWAGISLGKGF
ncbi:hypothetical protein GCM10028807_14290 [Spirosoma daeguense]